VITSGTPAWWALASTSSASALCRAPPSPRVSSRCGLRVATSWAVTWVPATKQATVQGEDCNCSNYLAGSVHAIWPHPRSPVRSRNVA